MKNNIYEQEICSNCLQALVNGQGMHTADELCALSETLEQWSGENYRPSGPTDDMEPFFSHRKCDLCGALPGDRYYYYFADHNQDKVVFLVHPDAPGEVFAYFPDYAADRQGNYMSYAHIGQHSACSPAYAQESRPATEREYKELYDELKTMYNIIV